MQAMNDNQIHAIHQIHQKSENMSDLIRGCMNRMRVTEDEQELFFEKECTHNRIGMSLFTERQVAGLRVSIPPVHRRLRAQGMQLRVAPEGSGIFSL